MKYGRKLLLLSPLTSVWFQSIFESRIMNHESWRKLFLFFFVILASYFLLHATAPLAQAQQSNYDVTVSPVFFDLSMNPGDSIDERIRIRNNTNSPIPIKIEVKKLVGDQNSQLTLSDTDEDGSLSWIKFENQTFTARPQEWTNIPFTINVPQDAAYGYYYTINFTQVDPNKSEATGASLTGAVAVPILLNVRKDGAKAEAKLVKFAPDSFINETLPVDFTVVIENTGNIHIRPRGNIFISRDGKNNIATLEVNPGQSGIIPQSSKEFSASWTDGFIVREKVMEDDQIKVDDDGNEITKLTINWNKLTDVRFGKYTANLLMVYDNGQRDVPIEASKSFWIIPWKAVAVVITGFVIIILLIRFVLKKYINREVKKKSSSK